MPSSAFQPLTRTALFAGSLLLAAGAVPASAGSIDVTDPANDTAMMRGGPDIVSTKTDFSKKRVTVKVKYLTSEHVDLATDGGTITGATLKFKGGGTYTLQRKSADPAFQTPLANEIVIGDTARRAKCSGVKSSVSSANRTVTVKAPVKCFKKDGPKLKSKGFSFTYNFDLDETEWSKWVKQG